MKFLSAALALLATASAAPRHYELDESYSFEQYKLDHGKR